MASIRHALRRLWRDRAVTVIALGVLALGLGANTALFAVLNAVLLKKLPYPSADRLVVVRVSDPEFRDRYASFPVNEAHLATWRDHCRSCEDIAAINGMTTTLTGGGEAEQLDGAIVSAGFLGSLGISPIVGRGFLPSEGHVGSNAVAVISYGLWMRRFGGDTAVIGRSIRLDGESVTIVGVLPSRAPLPGPQQLGDLVRLPRTIDVLRPLASTPESLRSAGDYDYGVVIRLRPGVTPDALRAELDGLEPEVARLTEDNGRKRMVVQPLQQLITRNSREPLTVLFVATVAVLLIVCVNLANLLLARHAGRRRDSAVRTALGASRTTLVFDSLIESLLLALGGGALGAAVAWIVTRVIAVTAPAALPMLNTFRFDANVLFFCAASAAIAGFGIGLVPALRNGRVDPGDVLKANSYTTTDGPRGARGRRVLVGVQAAIGVALLVTTGLLVLSFVRLVQVDKGFDTARVLTVDVALPPFIFASDEQRLRFFDDAIARLQVLPGVESVALTSRLPLRGEATVNLLSYVGDQRPMGARPLANYRYVTPDYFAAIGTPILRGRTFSDADRGRQVAVLSASTAETLWPGENPIGRQIKTGGYLGAVTEVIGVAADSRAVDLTRTNVLFTYLPYWLRGPSSASLILHTSVTPSALAAPARRAILDINGNVAIPRTDTMEEIVALSVADRRFQLSLMVAFGTAAALLAALGVYGVVSYSVARRGRELGIRIALGARPADIHRIVISEGLIPVAAGLAIGLALSWIIGRAIANQLFDVRPGDPAVMLTAAAIVTTATLLACAGPARRAASPSTVRALLP
jgi:putative ABC transport system permease protein